MSGKSDQSQHAKSERDRIVKGPAPEKASAKLLVTQAPGNVPEFLAGDSGRDQRQRESDAKVLESVSATDREQPIPLGGHRLPHQFGAAGMHQAHEYNDRCWY